MEDPMSDDSTIRMASAWGVPQSTVRHSYPLAVRDHGLGQAISLLMRSLPYALARFGILLACAVACIVWIVVAFGGAALLGSHIAGVFGFVWLLICLGVAGFFWGTILRYLLHLLACGHVAVLTELITKGQVGNGSEPMLAYGKRVVTERLGQVNALYALNLMVRGVLAAFHRTLDWIGEILPIPGLEGLANLANIILRAATRYLDKMILSYNLARGDVEPWQGGAITVMRPHAVREQAGIVTILVAALLAGPLRAAFLKPLFLIMMMVRFHALIENQPINQEWDARLATVSDKFRDLGKQAIAGLANSTGPAAGFARGV
jgi:hypothetical protein